jgi:hypothetical protein
MPAPLRIPAVCVPAAIGSRRFEHARRRLAQQLGREVEHVTDAEVVDELAPKPLSAAREIPDEG